MKRIAFFFALLGIFEVLSAQVLYKDSVPAFKNAIKISPFNIIDPVTPNLEVSYERLLTNTYSSQLSAAYILKDNFLLGELNNISSKGFRIKFEGRRSLGLTTTGQENKYVALEASHLYQEEKLVKNFGGCEDCFSTPFDSSMSYRTGYNDTIRLYRNMTIINLKLGIQSTFNKHFFLDFYCGLGLKFRSVTHSERINEDDKITYDGHHPQSRRDDARKSLVPSIPVNLKVGYRF